MCGLMHCSKQTSLLDHLVGDREHARWNGKAERLGGLEIDDQLELGWLHDRQVGGLVPLENPAHLLADLPIEVRNAGTIAQEAALQWIITEVVQCGHCMPRHQRD